MTLAMPRVWSQVDSAVAVTNGLAPDQIAALPHFTFITNALTAGEMTVEQATIKTLSCTASSTIKDLHGDVMTQDCVSDMAKQARKNLTIFLNHKYSAPEDVAGKVTNAHAAPSGEKDENGAEIWDLHYDIALTRHNPRVEQTYSQIREDGIRLGVSIGAYILEYDYLDKDQGFWGGLIINKVLLVETSIVGIPANQRSWVQNGVIAIGKHMGLPELFNDPEAFEERLEKRLVRVLNGKEAAPLMKTASITAAKSTVGEAGEETITGVATAIADDATPTIIETTTDSTEEPEVTAEATPGEESSAEAETEPEVEETGGETPEADAAEALEEAAPEIALSLKAGSTPSAELVLAALEHAANLLHAVRAEKTALDAQVALLTGERDQAIKDRDDAAELIELMAKSPLGRKTKFTAPVQSMRAKFAGMYDEDFLNLIDNQE